MKTIILAAGYGTRLYPLTKNKAKALLSVGNRTLIDFTVEKILEILPQDNIIIVVSNSRFYADFLRWKEAYSEKAKIAILDDGSTNVEDRRGAVGDIYFAVEKESIKEDILVMGSDNIFDWRLDGFLEFAHAKSTPTVGLYDLEDYDKARRFGVAEIDTENKIVSFLEKPQNPPSTLISVCLYYFPQDSLSLIEEYLKKENSRDAAGSYIKWLSEKTKVYGYVFKGKWLDIGHKDSLEKAKSIFATD